MESIKEEKIGSYKLVVSYDEFAENPREWDVCSTIYSNHRHINPDGHSIDEVINGDGELQLEGMLAMRVYLYNHSGYAFSVTELDGKNPYSDSYRKWDSGLFGIIAMPNKIVKSYFGGDEKKAKEWMVEQINSYEKYANGEVYRYEVIEPNGDVYDSCGGYFSSEEAYEDGKAYATELAKDVHKEVETILAKGDFKGLKEAYLHFKPNEGVEALLDALSEGKTPTEFLREEVWKLLCEMYKEGDALGE